MIDWADALRWGVAWGPGVLILVGLYKLLKEPPKFVEDFVESQQAQAVAITKMAVAVESSTQKDDYRNREVLGVLTVLAEDMREVKRRLRGDGE